MDWDKLELTISALFLTPIPYTVIFLIFLEQMSIRYRIENYNKLRKLCKDLLYTKPEFDRDYIFDKIKTFLHAKS